MRIALLIHGWPPAAMGGTGLYVEALAGALARAHDVALVAPGAAGAASIEPVASPPGLERVTCIRSRAPAPRRWEQTWRSPAAVEVFRQWERAWRPDVLHAHHLSGLPWELLSGSPAARVLTLHDYAIPCARGQLLDRGGALCVGPSPERCARCLADQLQLNPLTWLAGRALRLAPGLRVQAREHLAFYHTMAPSDRALARAAARLDDAAALLDNVEVLLSPSQDLATRLEGMGLRRPGLTTLPLIREIPAAPDPGDGPVRFLFASAIHPSKGADRLVVAFASLPAGAAALSVAGPCPSVDGDPTYAKRLEARVRAAPGAQWVGEVAPAHMGALLAAHDVLVLPSRWPENSPLVVREATAAGLRLIVSEMGGALELAAEARRVPPTGQAPLVEALLAEAASGRRRRAVARWPTPSEHAAELVENAYSAALSMRRQGARRLAPRPRGP